LNNFLQLLDESINIKRAGFLPGWMLKENLNEIRRDQGFGRSSLAEWSCIALRGASKRISFKWPMS
jgi:hypothetical protein